MWATDLESPKAMSAKSPRLPGEIAGKSNHFYFEPWVIAKALNRNYKLYEIQISYYGRDFSEGKKITWRDGVAAIWALIKYGFKERF